MLLYFKIFIIFFILLPVVQASGLKSNITDYANSSYKWSIRIHGGYATIRPLVAIIMLGDVRLEKRYTSIQGLDFSHYFLHSLWGKPFDFSIRIGLIHHDEKGYQPNYLQYNIFLLGHYKTTYRGYKMRWFFGEGFSYAEQVPYVEGRDTRRLSNERDSRLMNYLNVGFDFSVGNILRRPSLNNLSLGFAVSHRSGVFGTFKWFNNTSGGGNFNTIFLEYKR